MKHIVIADLKSNNNYGICTGHYYALAENYRNVFSDITTVKIAGGPIYKNKFKIDDLELLPFDYIAGDSRIKNCWRMIRNAACLFSKVNTDDIVIIQDSQPYMILIALLFTYRNTSNLFQIHYSDEPIKRPLYACLYMFFKRNVKGNLCPNDRIGRAYGVPYCAIPDYLYSSIGNKSSWGFQEKKYDFCLIGRISEDKGVAEAVKTLSNKQCSVLVAGQVQVQEEGLEILKSASRNGNIKTVLKYLSDEEYALCLQKSRYCVLNYNGSYADRSSGVALDTIFRDVPVVGKRCSALQFIEDFHIGYLYDDIEQLNVANLLSEEIYRGYVDSIGVYKERHISYKSKLCEFWGLDD